MSQYSERTARPRAERARHVADLLRQQITDDAFPGGLLPDEGTLGRHLGASRNAVREALGLLREEGLVTRRRGVGTSVVAPKLGHGLDRLAGLAETLAGHGTVTNEVRVAETVSATAAVADRLEVEPGDDVVRIERLRRLDDQPLSLDTSYLVADVGRRVLDADLVHRDVFAVIEEVTGGRLGRAEVAVHAVNADAGTARLLDVPAGAAVFAIERSTFLPGGRVVDVESLRIRADRLTLRATLHRGPAAG
ncbi:GntR family transcriptional regulator [Jiangella alba]|uniref:GntR family transcriptional regulator n=1 Tax=Jiangella alba TaxID=561176 RepID=UPI00083F10AA|nr:GntR family transcriptional regulator [Jiangella alba]